MIQTPWDKQEVGWYTHPKLGGICHESDRKWWWYPKAGTRIGTEVLSGTGIGPFETFHEAKESAERAPLYNPTKA